MKTLLALCLLTVSCWADGPKNCKLTVRTNTENKKKVDVELVHARDRADCKAQAREREAKDPNDAVQVVVSSSWLGE